MALRGPGRESLASTGREPRAERRPPSSKKTCKESRQNVSKNVGGWQGPSDEVSEGIEETVTRNWRKAVPGDQAAKLPSPPTTPPQLRPGLVPWCLQEGRTSSRKAGEQGNWVFGRGYQRNVEGAAWFLLPAFSEMGGDRDGKMALLIRREVKLEGREYSQPVQAVKNEKSCLRDDFQGVAKRPSDKEMSQPSQQKPRAMVQDNGRMAPPLLLKVIQAPSEQLQGTRHLCLGCLGAPCPA